MLFLAANLFAAFLNYLYQVLASRQLTPSEFAALNGWIANLAPLFVFATLLQYQANFRPAERWVLRLVGVLMSLAAVPAVFIWWNLNDPTGLVSSGLVFLFTAAFSWQFGQVQIRLWFKILAMGSLLMAGGRILASQIQILGNPTFHQFVFANLAAAAVIVFIFTGILWSAPDTGESRETDFWRRAATLSIAGAMLPQFDMLLMNHTQAHESFVAFAQASLFGRAVYALTAIGAAWLLPNQIRGKKIASAPPRIVTVALVLAICAIVAAVSPHVGRHIFGWETPPGRTLVFLTSAELSFLAVIFVLVQTACAQHDLRRAAFFMIPLGIEALVQMVLRLPAMAFLLMAVIVQAALILLVPNTKSKHTPSLTKV